MSAHVSVLSFAAVGIGGACGTWLRWGLGMLLNPLFAPLPLGTLAVNVVGGFLMGGVLAAVQAWPEMPPALKLLLTTGLLGGLTTFSTFSAEGLLLAQRGAWGWLAVHTAAHVLGALLAAWVGFALFNALRA
ncbi:fluoride efflux transporter CrcB [Pseudothauera rhizosphaerae]|uniref:Fluoride-specific ion channel FluC n=1 Tax=Pseudothauera rhizosphaerae TaxID=2565932 RepID=A0A4S4AEV6_9RHOO|nr:fluoride efflux transporter CrcB [Pseudothauera rhizosphaerae]THF57710.1 fluoride efflux transporter CrcB [Pseudothauera rhizosphaerae]